MGASTVEIEGQRMYEDEGLILLWSKGPFGISYPLLCSIHIYLKKRQLAIKATGQEKRFLLATIVEWQQLGLSMQQLKDTDLFHDFAQAVACRGGARWNMFFRQNGGPKQAAELYRPNT